MYHKLKKIKRPVFIELETTTYLWRNRFRILYPNGKCEYITYTSERDYLNPSCFAYKDFELVNPKFYKLSTVLKKMKDYDMRIGLKIVKIIEL